MRKVLLFAGSTLLLSGTLLFGMVYLGISNYAGKMMGWSDPPGKFTIAMNDTMLRAPHIISILFIIFGLILFAIAISNELMEKKLENHEKEQHSLVE